MHKKRRPQQGQTIGDKPQRPRPEWTTDFQDRTKYRLSEIEMIQKKAALQSNNREIARKNLEQRRRKLQMGVIDQQTRKIYQTALLAKKIDINPPNRRNLSQMIQYQKDKQAQLRGQQVQYEQQEGMDQFEQQLKNTQAFIKKMQKASKQNEIQRAVEILESASGNSNKNKSQKESFVNNTLKSRNQSCQDPSSESYDEHLSSIEDTIRFMEEQLFSKGTSKVTLKNNYTSNNYKQEVREESDQEDRFISQTENLKLNLAPQQQPEYSAVSHLKLSIQEGEEVVDVDCMDTIRRMRQMIESKEHLYDFGHSEPRQKQNQPFISTNNHYQDSFENSFLPKDTKQDDSSAEIDFSLTVNESHLDSRVKESNFFIKENYQVDLEFDEYEKVKRTLFEEVNKIKSYSLDDESETIQIAPVKQKEAKKKIKEKGFPKQKKINPELEKIKSMVNGTKSSVDSLKVQSLNIGKTSEMGFDFRGSINIKKNLIQ